MAEPIAVTVPRENVNDDTAKLVAWFVEDGARVEAGRLLAQVETSKAVLDIEAPANGVVRFNAKAGDEVAIGGLLCRIGDDSESIKAPLPKAEDPSAAPATPALAPVLEPAPHAMAVAVATNGHTHEAASMASAPRFSRGARELLAARGIDPSTLTVSGLVRSEDLRLLLSSPSPLEGEGRVGGGQGMTAQHGRLESAGVGAPPAMATPHPNPPPQGGRGSEVVPATGVGFHTETLPRAKKTEAKYIRSAYDSTLASVVTVSCPTQGFRARAGDLAPALIVFETARLLRKYPSLNAFHRDGTINYYDEVNVGYAMDAEHGLKVPVVRQADKKSVAEIADELREALVAYLGDELPFESLAGGTFTVTDLAGEGVASFVPLINQGQSAILGVGGEVAGQYSLVLTFDHQLSEGRLAARFLNDLKTRLVHHEGVMSASSPSSEMPSCARCMRTAEELDPLGIFLVPTARPGGASRLLCTRCLRGR
jgi:pyruvate/2-oxoglutarate dehydrogenase complex dihydrolipoamide acyltransferase (E2) component